MTMKAMVIGGLALLLALPLPAAAGGPDGTAPLTLINWQDATYSSACFSNRPQTFVARHGMAQSGFVHFQVYTPIFTDLSGDGRPEALIPYSCTGADFGGVHLFVYTGTAAQPHLLGEIPASTEPAIGGLASVHSVTIPALTVLPSQRELAVEGVGFSPTATHTCPDLQVTLRYRVAGGRLLRVGGAVTHARGCLGL